MARRRWRNIGRSHDQGVDLIAILVFCLAGGERDPVADPSIRVVAKLAHENAERGVVYPRLAAAFETRTGLL
jgi:hypothetical protein